MRISSAIGSAAKLGTLAGVALLGLALVGPASAGAADVIDTDLTRGVVGYGTVHVDHASPPADCTSSQSNPGGIEADVDAGSEFDCAAFTGDDYATCVDDGSGGGSCSIGLTAQVAGAGWRFDHWSGDCSGTDPDCTITTSATTCDPERKPPCSTQSSGPFNPVAHFVDTRAPTVDTSGPKNPVDHSVVYEFDQDEDFFFSSNEKTEGTRFACREDSGPFLDCTSPYYWWPARDGIHTFCVRGTDASGLQGANACIQWEQERRPTAVFTRSPGRRVNAEDLANGVTFEYASNKSDHPDDGSTLRFACGLDDTSVATCPAAGRTYHSLPEGQNTFWVRAGFRGAFESGSYLNWSPPAGGGYTFTVDATRPNTTITSGPAGPTRRATPSFGFVSSEPRSTFGCRIDSKPYEACGSPNRLSPRLSDGSHTFSARAIDDFGNQDLTAAQRRFVVDTRSPSSAARAASSVRGDSIPVSYGASDPSPSSSLKAVELWVRRPGETGFTKAATDMTPTTTRAFSYTAAAKGTYRFYTRARDKAGNYEAAPRTADTSVSYRP